MKKVLVTGGAGFVGSNLCARLLADGNEVICLDNFHTGQKSNVRPLMDDPRFECIRHDVIDAYSIPVDRIYNLACPASPIHYQYDPIFTMRTCIEGAINALENARKWGGRVLQASTSEVYGDPDVHPQPETYRGNVNPVGIRACYDEGKRAAETLFFDYFRQHQMDIRVARIFNTYGPNMDPLDGRVVSNFIVQALKNDDISVNGEGLQTRSFCFVDDLVEGLIRLMESETSEPAPVNLGNPGEFTMIELAELIIELTGSKSKLAFHPMPEDDPRQRRPDISRAGEQLSWEPVVPLREGLKKTIAYFDQIL
jgi:UDP-glucuronate decarboxylase